MKPDVQKIIWNAVVDIAIKRIITALPFLSIPVLNPVVIFFLKKIADFIYSELAIHTKLTFISIRTDLELRAFIETRSNLMNVLTIPDTHFESEEKRLEAIKNAEIQFDNTVRNLIRFSAK